MTNDDSYKMMDARRRHMGLNGYETEKTLEMVLTFKTTNRTNWLD